MPLPLQHNQRSNPPPKTRLPAQNTHATFAQRRRREQAVATLAGYVQGGAEGFPPLGGGNVRGLPRAPMRGDKRGICDLIPTSRFRQNQSSS